MTDRPDRLWTLTDAERERARRVFEETPAALESLYLAALGEGQTALDSMRRVIEGARPCEP